MTFPHVSKDAHGVRRLIGRRLGQMAGSVVVCPDGHKLRGLRRWGDQCFAVECCHAAGASAMHGTATVHWLYLLPDVEGRTIVVECHIDEIGHIERGRLSVGEIRSYLGVTDARAA